MIRKTIVTDSIYDPSRKIWRGPTTVPKYGPECTIGEEAICALLKDPNHIAQICYHNGKEYTNRDIATLSIRMAVHFRSLNLLQCDIIGICALNSDYVAPVFFGAMLCGLTISTLDPSFDKDGIKHIYGITKPKLMFCDGAVYAVVSEALAELKLTTKIYTMKDHLAGKPNINEFLKPHELETSFKAEPLQRGSGQTAAVLCSSGTTGLPKGVCMSHISLLNNGITLMGPEDRILCFSSLYWASGLLMLIQGTLAGTTRIISDQSFKTDHLLDIVTKYKVTLTLTPPSQLALLAASPDKHRYDLSSLTTNLCGGSAVPITVINKLRAFMPDAYFYEGYGMSEVSGAVAIGKLSVNSSSLKLIANIEFKVIDDDGKNLGPNELGELCIKTPYHWAGYYDNPAATGLIYDATGWIHSGDIGKIDSNGHILITDRKKDILKYNNFHFFPTEIENVINELPGVTEVCVCGIPDDISTHLPAAAIVKSDDSLTEETVYKYVANRMAHFKHLRGGVYFLPELPKTASGKNLRRELTQICERLKRAKDSNTNTRRESSSSSLLHEIKV